MSPFHVACMSTEGYIGQHRAHNCLLCCRCVRGERSGLHYSVGSLSGFNCSRQILETPYQRYSGYISGAMTHTESVAVIAPVVLEVWLVLCSLWLEPLVSPDKPDISFHFLPNDTTNTTHQYHCPSVPMNNAILWLPEIRVGSETHLHHSAQSGCCGLLNKGDRPGTRPSRAPLKGARLTTTIWEFRGFVPTGQTGGMRELIDLVVGSCCSGLRSVLFLNRLLQKQRPHEAESPTPCGL